MANEIIKPNYPMRHGLSDARRAMPIRMCKGCDQCTCELAYRLGYKCPKGVIDVEEKESEVK